MECQSRGEMYKEIQYKILKMQTKFPQLERKLSNPPSFKRRIVIYNKVKDQYIS